MGIYRDLSEKIEAFRNMLMSYATGGRIDGQEYENLRDELDK